MIFIHRNFSPLLVLDKYALEEGNIINCLGGLFLCLALLF